MQVELNCQQCGCRFSSSPETTSGEVIEQMFEEGPWYALGDGETFEDMIFNTVFSEGDIPCAECGEAVTVCEESLGQLTMEMLGSW